MKTKNRLEIVGKSGKITLDANTGQIVMQNGSHFTVLGANNITMHDSANEDRLIGINSSGIFFWDYSKTPSEYIELSLETLEGLIESQTGNRTSQSNQIAYLLDPKYIAKLNN